MKIKYIIMIPIFFCSSAWAESFYFDAKPFNLQTMDNIPWGDGRPYSIQAVPKNLLSCLSEITFTYRKVPNQNLFGTGVLVVNNDLVEDLREILEELYNEPDFSMSLVAPIHHFNWDDDLSMQADNTSGFNFRYVSGTKKLSNHSKGRAIDINPRVNPWVNNSKTKIFPSNGSLSLSAPGSLLPGSPSHHLVKAFTSRGWEWGGDWVSFKDYQHFEKKISYPGSKYCEEPY